MDHMVSRTLHDGTRVVAGGFSQTVPNQVICKIDKVSYSCISRIKVSIDKSLAEEISKTVTDINQR